MPPIPLPVPNDCPHVIPGVPFNATSTGFPLILCIDVGSGSGLFGWLGQNLTFTATLDNPGNLGIYGPNPEILGINPKNGKTTGRMRAPKLATMPDGTNLVCQGNFNKGRYFLVFRTGANGPMVGNMSLRVASNPWQVFSAQSTPDGR